MHFTFFGCVITNYYAFQLFINYPLSLEDVTAAYDQALRQDIAFLQLKAKTGLNYIRNPLAPQLLYPGTTAQILWVNRKDFPKEMCDRLNALEELPETTLQFRHLNIKYLRGCRLKTRALHEEICRYINHFTSLERRALLVKGEMEKLEKEAMENLDSPSRKTTVEYYPPCDCPEWDCPKWEEKQEPPNRPYGWYGRNSGVWKVRSPDTLTQDKKEGPPKVACMAIGCPGSEPK